MRKGTIPGTAAVAASSEQPGVARLLASRNLRIWFMFAVKSVRRSFDSLARDLRNDCHRQSWASRIAYAMLRMTTTFEDFALCVLIKTDNHNCSLAGMHPQAMRTGMSMVVTRCLLPGNVTAL